MAAVQSSTQEKDLRATPTALAWGAILIVSTPTIILRLIVRDLPAEPLVPYWLGCAIMAVLAALWAVTWVWPAAKPLRGFFLALLAFGVGYLFILPAAYMSAAWSNWVENASWGVALVVAQVVDHVSIVPFMALTLIGSGIGWRELFLVRGDPKAPAQPTRLLPGLKESRPWNRVAGQFLPFFVIILVIVLAIQLRPNVGQISRAFVFLPALVIGAAINALGEEFEFRSVLLARLESVVGPRQAILITTGLFGLLHYFGVPGGPFGMLLPAYLGWVAAKSMIETRGLVWAFALHFLADFCIYAFAAMLA
jgi:hypothetical protein